MIRNSHVFLVTCFLLGTGLHGFSQNLGDYTRQEIKDLSQKVEDQVQFLEYFLNTVGSMETPARDKDVIIRESYKKIFRDGKVQVEDDLLLDRKVITNKDITAYLKDIEFFFKDASFKFKVREVKPFLRDNGELSFIASLDRTLTATGLNAEKISNTKLRFVEVNVDKLSNELKIASIYTTKLSRDEELAEWWSLLSLEWETFFREKYQFFEDTLELEQLYKISTIDSINISGNQLIQSLYPLEALRDLKYLDISDTNIEELNPISNVTFLTYLNIANTPTNDIQFIKYSDRLTHLDISGTYIRDISELGNLKQLHTLNAVRTPIMSFAVLNDFEALRSLNLGYSGFNNLENVQELRSLVNLNISGNFLINFELLSELESLEEINLQETNIVDLSPLKELKNLKVVNINQTEVADLTPLGGKLSLERVYADRTRISEDNANEFARRNRRVLLIHHVENLQTWWDGLPDSWKEVLTGNTLILDKSNPGVEDLSTLVSVDSLDLSNSQIKSLGPVLKFKKINHLNFDETEVQDLSPLADIKTLVSISGRNSQIKSLRALTSLNNLTMLDLRGNPVSSIILLKDIKSLQYLNVDRSEIDIEEIPGFLLANPEVNIIYRSAELEEWWNLLNDTWKGILKDNFDGVNNPDTEMLHRWAASPSLKVERASISNLAPLSVFVNLRELSVFDVPLTDISVLSDLGLLETLRISQAPINDISLMRQLENLAELDLSNTGVEDLRPLSNLQNLKNLNLSGTNVKVLRGLDNLISLEELDIASTNVRSLKPIQGLTYLKKLTCFNTRINSRAVANFRKLNPGCEVRYY